MNKKLLAIIIGAIAVLVALVIAIVAIVGSLSNSPDDKNSSENSSIGSSADSGSSTGSSSTGSTGNSGGSDSGSSGQTATPIIEKGGITIGSVSGNPGDTVTVPVSIKENPGLAGFQMLFTFDGNALEYVEYTSDVFDDNAASGSDDRVIFIEARDNDYKADGVLFNIVFKIKENAPKGAVDIKYEASASLLCNIDETTVKTAVTNGKVTVK